jgi:phospholipase C
MHRVLLTTCSALVSAGLLLAPVAAGAQTGPMVVAQPVPAPNSPYAAYASNPEREPQVSEEQLVQALRSKVKYVFVLFQENRSFDHYFGTFPGANGFLSDGVAPDDGRVPGFTQPIKNTDGTIGTIQPFRLGPDQHASDLDDVDHGHARMAEKMDLPGGTGTPKMDQFAVVEEAKYTPPGANAVPLKAKQMGELTMAYVDCDTIPFMWNYAARFTLFDDIFQTTIGPSTPNAIAMISGQTGETQWVKHPTLIGNKIPVLGDPIAFWGSTADPTQGPQRQPANTKKESSGTTNGTPSPANLGSNTSENLTFASLPITMAGKQLADVTKHDTHAESDLADLQQDIPFVTGIGHQPYAWRWYEEGYDHEPTDPAGETTHNSYIGHHNGAQYFGYVSNNPQMTQNEKGLGDFFTDMQAGAMPQGGGVIFVRGGYNDINGTKPAFNTDKYPGSAEAAAVQANFAGDDDHPGYSDSELSEGLIAREINAIARSPYWDQSAIVVTYDESEGDWDHVPPRILSYDPSGLPLSRGPRIPLLLVSPYARAHAVSHQEGDHNSVIKLINAVFNLPPLADLPDELQARIMGEDAQFAKHGITQLNLGPHDDRTPGTGDLLTGFDPARLMGSAPPIPASYAELADDVMNTLPHYDGQGCKALGITPTDQQLGYHYPIPADFNPRPLTFPTPAQ